MKGRCAIAYFSNSTDGDVLDQQCASCPLGDEMCPILAVQLAHNYDQIGNDKLKAAMNLLVNEKGVCQLKPLLPTDEPQRLPGDPPAWLEQKG